MLQLIRKSVPLVWFLENGNLGVSSAAWQEFRAVIEEWTRLAKSLSPNVLVIAYPDMSYDENGHPYLEDAMQALQGRFEKLCQEAGVEYIDLHHTLRNLDNNEIAASVYGGHPSATAHTPIVAFLFQIVQEQLQRLRKDSSRTR